MGTVQDAILGWYIDGERGVSSECIAHTMIGSSPRYPDHPHDPSDFRRCLLLLERLPERSIDRMRDVSPSWRALVEHWDELVELYSSEAATGNAPKTYALMRKILATPEKREGWVKIGANCAFRSSVGGQR